MMLKFGNDWDEILSDEFEKDYYLKLREFLLSEYRNGTVYPPADDIFNAFRYTGYEDTKVVILGQDPYHEPGQAQGLAFSVPGDIKYPPSLVNILKELESDIGAVWDDVPAEPGAPVLKPWAEQGVLLLNTSLTVRAHEAGSHRGKGWEIFTDRVIELLAGRKRPMVFILWGANAATKKSIIQKSESAAGTRHLVITAPHPSPLSAYRGFFGGRYFSRANFLLEDIGDAPIDWRLHRTTT